MDAIEERSKIRVEWLKFGDPAFRKLGKLTIDLSERLTVIAGHNGIGKSSILALVANASGLTSGVYQSYFGRTFQANIYEIIFLDYENEYEAIDESARPSIRIQYRIGDETLVKRCALAGRTARRELRVVPRNEPHKKVTVSGIEVGSDGKVPMPTIYLGMTRMLPIGESNPEWITSEPDAEVSEEDADYIRDVVNQVIPLSSPSNSRKIVTQAIKGTSKVGKHPIYGHNTKAISVGQDSLSSIATALASFKRLKRDWPGYPGGLLIIDELDAGLHPSAQRRLVDQVRTAARDLNLQVVATTHSMPLIRAVHPEGLPAHAQAASPDSVVYLADTRRPVVFQDQSLLGIQNDMDLVAPSSTPYRRPAIKVYLEDPEAYDFFKSLLTPALRARVRKEVGVNLKPIPLSVGCENLKAFPKHDAHFKKVAIVLDADASVTKNGPKNITGLPGGIRTSSGKSNPENTIFRFARAIVEGKFGEAQERLVARNVTTDQIQEHLLDGVGNLNDRETAKRWYQKRKKIVRDWKLVDEWALEHSALVEAFGDNLIAAAKAAKRAEAAG